MLLPERNVENLFSHYIRCIFFISSSDLYIEKDIIDFFPGLNFVYSADSLLSEVIQKK